MSFLPITKKELTAARKGGTLFSLVPAGRRQLHQDRPESQELDSRQGGRAQVLGRLV